MQILIVEYPKSGGTWLCSMLATALGISVRDLYLSDTTSSPSFDLNRHPWYEGEESKGLVPSCVIKSHELPNTTLHPAGAAAFHLVRDGRDVAVSRYFYERDFCVNNGIRKRFDITFSQHVRSIAQEWEEFVGHWQRQPVPTVKYEHLLADAREVLQSMIQQLGLYTSPDDLEKAVNSHTKERMRASLSKVVKHNTFVRKGVSGDWRNYFTRSDCVDFENRAGVGLRALGYTSCSGWVAEFHVSAFDRASYQLWEELGFPYGGELWELCDENTHQINSTRFFAARGWTVNRITRNMLPAFIASESDKLGKEKTTNSDSESRPYARLTMFKIDANGRETDCNDRVADRFVLKPKIIIVSDRFCSSAIRRLLKKTNLVPVRRGKDATIYTRKRESLQGGSTWYKTSQFLNHRIVNILHSAKAWWSFVIANMRHLKVL
jgi:hypothetical protein